MFYNKPTLTETKVNITQERTEILKKNLGMPEYLTMQEDVSEDRIFFFSVCNDNLLNAINTICFEIDHDNFSEAMKSNSLMNKELWLPNQNTVVLLEDKR